MSAAGDTRALSVPPWQCDDLGLPAEAIRLLQRVAHKLRKRADFRVQIVEHGDNDLQVWVKWWCK
jgi:hypothetical protein